MAKILQKWNWIKHKYEKYEIPEEWFCKTYCNDLKEIVNCPHCGRKIKFGDSYTSREIHTPVLTFGYAVCESCYEKEWERSKKSELQT